MEQNSLRRNEIQQIGNRSSLYLGQNDHVFWDVTDSTRRMKRYVDNTPPEELREKIMAAATVGLIVCGLAILLVGQQNNTQRRQNYYRTW